MKTIRFLRPFVSTQRVSISGPDLALTPVGESERRHLVVRPEEAKFIAGEEVGVLPYTVEEKQRIIVGSLDQRMGAVLGDAVEGSDFEYVN